MTDTAPRREGWYAPAVVMPVYNEAPTLDCVLDAVRAYHDGPVIVVDDGSTDATPDILASRKDVVALTHEANRGYGASLRSGFDGAFASGSDAIVAMDVDGQHEPRHIPEFLAVLAEGADIVSGSRYLPASREGSAAPPDRRRVNLLVTEEVNRVTGWTLTDAFCGFKAYRVSSLRRMCLTEPGYAMPLELWARAYQAGLNVVEAPVERIYFDHDRSFGEDLDDPDKRLEYYMRVWRSALEGSHVG